MLRLKRFVLLYRHPRPQKVTSLISNCNVQLHSSVRLNSDENEQAPPTSQQSMSSQEGSKSQQSYRNTHWETRRSPSTSSDSDPYKTTERERIKSVTSYYNQYAIDAAAAKHSVRLTPASLLYTGKSQDDLHLLRSAQYLHRELPVRIAHRIAGFRQLPFIVGCNPIILSVHDLYIRSFKILSDFPPITSMEEEMRYTQMLRGLLDDHKDIMTMLAAGFREVEKHLQDPALVRRFLDTTLTSRLALRMLAEHHIALHEGKPNHIGIIKLNFCPRKVVEYCANGVTRQCEARYGKSPSVRVQGHVNASFPYISPPVEYIITELLKNSFGATVEQHIERSSALPEIVVTVASNGEEFFFRISDMGGGIPLRWIHRVWDYNFSSSDARAALSDTQITDRTVYQRDNSGETHTNISSNTTASAAGGFRISDSMGANIFGEFVRDTHHSPMRGFGFGLPTSRAYAMYMGGELKMESMQGYGTDAFLRLRHINATTESFRI